MSANAFIQAGIQTGLTMAIGGLKPKEALLQYIVNVAASCGAQKIGEWRHPTDPNVIPISWTEHKLLHALNGAFQGAASDLKHPLRGAAAGAMGAVGAEIIAEALPGSLSPSMRSNIARGGAATLAFLTRQDVNVAIQAGTTAAEFNYEAHKSGPLAQKLTEDEFVKVHLEDWERKRGPLSEQERKRMIVEFRRGYNAFKLMDFSRSFFNPGQQRFEEQASLSYEEFKAQQLSQMDPKKLATVQGRQDAERIIRNHYNFFQSRGFDLALEWIEKAAKQNLAPTQYTLRTMYAVGIGVSQSYTLALEWIKKAANQNVEPAKFLVNID